MALASEALDSARVYLNDTANQIWSNTKLLPFLKEAYRDLLVQLWLNGIPVIKEKTSTPIEVAAGDLSLTLPADFIEPIRLKERLDGTSDSYSDMTEKEFEPDYSQSESLNYWAFREGAIQFVGATTAREILLYYWKSLTVPTAANSALGFTFAEIFLGPQTAGYASGSVGNLTLAGQLLYIPPDNLGVAGSKLDAIIRANIKGQQSLPARRIPFRRANRSRRFF